MVLYACEGQGAREVALGGKRRWPPRAVRHEMGA
jgi:hypothetical protein